MPAYVIFHDATLREIARRRPATEDDLIGVSGVGDKKRANYGADVVNVVANN